MIEEALDPLDTFGVEAEARPVAIQEPAAEPAAEQEARQVAGHGADPDQGQKGQNLDLAAGGDDATDDDRGLTRNDEADEGAGLEQREDRNDEVGPGAQRVGGIGEHRRDVRGRDRAGGEGEPRRDCRRDQGGGDGLTAHRWHAHRSRCRAHAATRPSTSAASSWPVLGVWLTTAWAVMAHSKRVYFTF